MASEKPFLPKFNGSESLSSEEFLKVFNKYDKDGNGYIDKGELDNFIKDVIRQRVTKITEVDDLKKIVLEKYDANMDGKISLSELAKILPTQENYLATIASIPKHQRLHVADFMKIWYHYDGDKSGYLESSELKGFLRDYLSKSLKQDEKLTPKSIEDQALILLDAFDKNKDGKIELSELSKFLNVQDNFLTKFKNDSDQLTVEEFEKIFDYYDRDGNGYIEDVELLGFLRDLLQNQHREPITTDLEMYRSCILEISDKDLDGKLSKSELRLLLLNK